MNKQKLKQFRDKLVCRLYSIDEVKEIEIFGTTLKDWIDQELELD